MMIQCDMVCAVGCVFSLHFCARTPLFQLQATADTQQHTVQVACYSMALRQQHLAELRLEEERKRLVTQQQQQWQQWQQLHDLQQAQILQAQIQQIQQQTMPLHPEQAAALQAWPPQPLQSPSPVPSSPVDLQLGPAMYGDVQPAPPLSPMTSGVPLLSPAKAEPDVSAAPQPEAVGQSPEAEAQAQAQPPPSPADPSEAPAQAVVPSGPQLTAEVAYPLCSPVVHSAAPAPDVACLPPPAQPPLPEHLQVPASPSQPDAPQVASPALPGALTTADSAVGALVSPPAQSLDLEGLVQGVELPEGLASPAIAAPVPSPERQPQTLKDSAAPPDADVEAPVRSDGRPLPYCL